MRQMSAKATLKKSVVSKRVEHISEIPRDALEKMQDLIVQISTLYPSFKKQMVDSSASMNKTVVTWYNVFKAHQVSSEMAFDALYRIQTQTFYPYPTASDLIKAAEVQPEEIGLPGVEAAFM